MCWRRCVLIALCAVSICQTRIKASPLSNSDEAVEEDHRAESGIFSTPCHFTQRKYFNFNPSTESPAKQLFIEIDLSNLQEGEIFVIVDNRPEKYAYQSHTYRRTHGELRILDKSYNVGMQSWKPVRTPVVTFETSHEIVKALFRGNKELTGTQACGGISGTYHRYSKDESNRCRIAELPPVSAESSLDCDNLFGGNATRCTGDFICPPHHTSIGEGICQDNSWKLVCAPDDTFWEQFYSSCTESVDGTISLVEENCPLSTTYLRAMVTADTSEMNPDGNFTVVIVPGRAVPIAKIEKVCSRFCSPKAKCMVDYFPDDVTNKMLLQRFIRCNKCVHNYACDFNEGRAFGLFHK